MPLWEVLITQSSLVIRNSRNSQAILATREALYCLHPSRSLCLVLVSQDVPICCHVPCHMVMNSFLLGTVNPPPHQPFLLSVALVMASYPLA